MAFGNYKFLFLVVEKKTKKDNGGTEYLTRSQEIFIFVTVPVCLLLTKCLSTGNCVRRLLPPSSSSSSGGGEGEPCHTFEGLNIFHSSPSVLFFSSPCYRLSQSFSSQLDATYRENFSAFPLPLSDAHSIRCDVISLLPFPPLLKSHTQCGVASSSS